MENGILPPELKSIEQLFTGYGRYAVPKYQRSFAWGTDEVEELWEDISAASGRGGDYFLGTIVLHKKGDGRQDIIDGQQRLACISMLFSAIRNVFLASDDNRAEQLFHSFLGSKGFSKNAPLVPNLILNEINNVTYIQNILESRNLADVDVTLKDKHLHESNRALLKAYRYFLNKITSAAAAKGTASDEFLVPLIDCLRQNVKVITIPVSSEEDANLFFESLNARGKELAVSDLVKNRLYSEAGDQVSNAQQLWDQMETDLGRRPIPEFLRHFWIAEKADTKEPIIREKVLYRMITQTIRGKKAETISLLSDLAFGAQNYAKITDYSLWPDDTAYDKSFENTLDDLRLFRVTQCNPVLLNAIQYFKTPKEIAKVFRIVADFSFRYFIIGNQSSGNLERVSNSIAIGIRTGTYDNPKTVADAFRAVNPDASFRSDFGLAAVPKSRSKLARYILAKLTNYLSKQSGKAGGEKIVNPDSKEVTLEHILPQKPETPWLKDFPKDEDPSDYIYRIGNLTLLAAKINHDAANKSFKEKKGLALDNSTLPINQYFKNLKTWNHEEINKRQEQLAKYALEVWKL